MLWTWENGTLASSQAWILESKDMEGKARLRGYLVKKKKKTTELKCQSI